MIRDQLIDEAREFMGTKFIHQGRMKGRGVDCIGLLVMVPKNLGFECHDHAGYSRQPSPRHFIEELSKGLYRIDEADARVGDVAVFFILREDIPQHVGILAPSNRADVRFNVIHTNAMLRKVVECPLTGVWAERVHSYWRYRGVEFDG